MQISSVPGVPGYPKCGRPKCGRNSWTLSLLTVITCLVIDTTRCPGTWYNCTSGARRATNALKQDKTGCKTAAFESKQTGCRYLSFTIIVDVTTDFRRLHPKTGCLATFLRGFCKPSHWLVPAFRSSRGSGTNAWSLFFLKHLYVVQVFLFLVLLRNSKGPDQDWCAPLMPCISQHASRFHASQIWYSGSRRYVIQHATAECFFPL